MPQHKHIIEPFAGAAAYSVRWGLTHDVWLNDLNPKTFAIWCFLTSAGAVDAVRTYVPESVEIGQRISDILPNDAPEGLRYLLQAQCNQGTGGQPGNYNQVTSMSASSWHSIIPRLTYLCPRIRHWTITNVDYRELANIKGTWFIDPPYNNTAGNRYAFGSRGIDFAELAQWCYTREGNTIVCENEGADWMPFEVLCKRRGVKSRYQVTETPEVVYLSDKTELPL